MGRAGGAGGGDGGDGDIAHAARRITGTGTSLLLGWAPSRRVHTAPCSHLGSSTVVSRTLDDRPCGRRTGRTSSDLSPHPLQPRRLGAVFQPAARVA